MRIFPPFIDTARVSLHNQPRTEGRGERKGEGRIAVRQEGSRRRLAFSSYESSLEGRRREILVHYYYYYMHARVGEKIG